jgi:hypothetical protein
MAAHTLLVTVIGQTDTALRALHNQSASAAQQKRCKAAAVQENNYLMPISYSLLDGFPHLPGQDPKLTLFLPHIHNLNGGKGPVQNPLG